MLSYCFKCRKNTESKNSNVVMTKDGRIILLSQFPVLDSKKSKFVIEQEAGGLLSSLKIKTTLTKISLVGSFLLWEYKMNERVTKFLLAGDKFMPEMHLSKPRFTYSACDLFTKNKGRIQNSKKQEIHNIFIKIN